MKTNRYRALSLITALVLVLGHLLTPAVAGWSLLPEEAPNQWTRSDLQRFVDLAYANQITPQDVSATYQQLTDAQKETLKALIFAKPRVEQEAMLGQADRQSQSGPVIAPAGLNDPEIWRQNIEPSTGGIALVSTLPNWWEACPNKDGDPNDMDYCFHFSISYSQNANQLVWSTSDAWVALVFFGAYQSNLTGFASHWDEVYLLIGDGAVGQIGTSRLMSSLRVEVPLIY